MDVDAANERLQVIRTLMERSAIYRRALSPIMIYLGILGIVACVVGAIAGIETALGFTLFWMAVGLVGILGAFILARRQAFRDREPFWSPPTRRVTLALLPPLFTGAVIGFVLTFSFSSDASASWAIPVTWILLYGCALHAAGFFTPRGMRLLGLLFILGGSSLTLSSISVNAQLTSVTSHMLMGIFFGGLQLAYGIYVHFTDRTECA
jgi:hypothetical protein